MFIALAVSACGASSASQTESDEKMHTAPSDEPVVMPKTPDVNTKGVGIAQSEATAESLEGTATEVEVTRGEVDGFMRRGPAYVLTVVTVEPVHKSKGFQGYKVVAATSKAKDFMTPFLKTGDVITHVNGIRIERPDDLLQAWNTLADASLIRVDFFRNEEKMHAAWAVR